MQTANSLARLMWNMLIFRAMLSNTLAVVKAKPSFHRLRPCLHATVAALDMLVEALPAQLLLVLPCTRHSCACCTGGCNSCLR
mmetsp:Transcript_27462/g.55486  ORF Transcript_27462/g.55486 Transcript_27462/m.55486 type:complete len:83 (+) Transcript_27462:148-396(+)